MNIIKFIINKRKETNAMKMYGEYYKKSRLILQKILYYFRYRKKHNIAIWGAGYKGRAFLKVIDPKKRYIDYVFDIDKGKFGNVMETGHEIVSYSDAKYRNKIDVIFIMNSKFETEIAGLLKEEDFHAILVNVDSIICGKLTAKEALKLYRRKV